MAVTETETGSERTPNCYPDLKANAGNWVREVKPLMRQGKHSSDVCLPLPNVLATTDQHFTIAPTDFYLKIDIRDHPVHFPSPYSVCITLWLSPKEDPSNIMVLTQNSFPVQCINNFLVRMLYTECLLTFICIYIVVLWTVTAFVNDVQ